MKQIRAVLAVSLLLACVACKAREPQPAAAGGETSRPSTRGGETYEDKFQIGKTAGANGKVALETDRFTAGDSIHISFVVGNLPAGTPVKATWKRIDGDATVSEEQKPLPDSGFITFLVKDTSTWKPGAYRLVKTYESKASGASAWKWLGTKDLTISPK